MGFAGVSKRLEVQDYSVHTQVNLATTTDPNKVVYPEPPTG